MKVQFVITIDTEEDQWDNYSAENNTVDNIDFLLPLQKIFDRYGAVPTYLVNWPVISGRRSSRIIKKLHNEHRCEIGTHCHPWNTPPYSEPVNAANSMMCNLPPRLIGQKMERLHAQIVKTLNLEPVCFRAGRWGFSPHVAKCLLDLKYQIDTSITPFVDWSACGGPDFSRASTFRYRFHADDILGQREDGDLLEVPVSTGFLQGNFPACAWCRQTIASTSLRKLRLLGILDKVQLLNFRWLSPELSSGADMIRLMATLVRGGHRVLNFMFHSTSLLPGKSPYVRNREDAERFGGRIEEVLEYCAKSDFEFVPLSRVSREAGPPKAGGGKG